MSPVSKLAHPISPGRVIGSGVSNLLPLVDIRPLLVRMVRPHGAVRSVPKGSGRATGPISRPRVGANIDFLPCDAPLGVADRPDDRRASLREGQVKGLASTGPGRQPRRRAQEAGLQCS